MVSDDRARSVEREGKASGLTMRYVARLFGSERPFVLAADDLEEVLPAAYLNDEDRVRQNAGIKPRATAIVQLHSNGM